jgi:surfactin synthase thioesterase subunit
MALRFSFQAGPGDVGLRSAGRGPRQLVCLPCAGGAATAFLPLAQAVDPGWRTLAVEPPGHGFNSGACLDEVGAMVDRVGAALEGQLAEPYVLFGHSLGGLVAHRLCARLEAGPRPPAALVICTLREPFRLVDEPWSTLDDDALIDRIDGIGGVPEVFKEAREEFKAFIGPVRTDFRALERFDPQTVTPVRTRTFVLAAADDPFATPALVEGWTRHAVRASFDVLPGGHFLPQSDPRAVAAWLDRVVAPTIAL